MMLDGDYFELLGVHERQPGNRRWTDILDVREGLAALALRTADSRADEARLVAAGVAMSPTVDYGRPVDADGVRGLARFSSAHADPAATPGMRLFLCQHHTPELVWAPVWQTHPNGARRIVEVAGLCDDPTARRDAWARLAGDGATRVGDGELTVALGANRLRFTTPAAFATAYGHDGAGLGGPALAALVLATGNLAATHAHLAAAGVATHRHGARLFVAPADACGVLLGFEEEAAGR